MPIKDTKEGSTHHEFDSCYKCEVCNSHINFTNCEFTGDKEASEVTIGNPECEKPCDCTGERERNHTLCKKCEGREDVARVGSGWIKTDNN